MRKTDLILQFLDSCDAPQSTSEVAAGIGDADDTKSVSSLLTYLKTAGRAQTVTKGAGGVEATWQITASGRQWYAELRDEATELPVEKARHVVGKRAREKAADPEKLPKLKTKRVQRRTAKVQPAPALIVPPARVNGSVALTSAAPIIGRAIAVREDGAVLVIEDDVVINTLPPDDARRIAVVVNRLMGAAA